MHEMDDHHYPYCTRRSSGSSERNTLSWSIAAKGPALTHAERAEMDNKDKDKNFILRKIESK